VPQPLDLVAYPIKWVGDIVVNLGCVDPKEYETDIEWDHGHNDCPVSIYFDY
jgi:hypothetical protein